MEFQDYKEYFEKNETILKSQQRFRSELQMYSLKRLARLHSVQMMIREYKYLMESSHIHLA